MISFIKIGASLYELLNPTFWVSEDFYIFALKINLLHQQKTIQKMKKIILLSGICLSISAFTFGQQALNKKAGTKILEKTWACVKANDTNGFIKTWALDDKQWPYHAGQKFTIDQVRTNFSDFKSYFAESLTKSSKFDVVECDTVSKDDPHYDFSKYYIRGWFKQSDNTWKGFGFYMDYVGDKWLARFSPDYSFSKTAPGK